MAEEIDYLMSVDMFNNPAVINGERAQALKIVRLILMNPGSDPLHPNMGVGLKRYRYALNAGGNKEKNGLNDLAEKTKEQIDQYLPHLRASSSVNFTITVEHILSIEITVNNTMFIYSPDDSIYPDDISNT